MRGRIRDSELPRGAPQKCGITEWLCRGQEQQPPRVAREPRQPPPEALLDPGGQRQRSGQAETAGELGGGQPAGELQERERIAARLGDDPLEHRFVKSCREDGLQERSCITAAQLIDLELRKPGQASAQLTRRKNKRDPLGKQAAGDERERSARCVVEPLRVVDHAEERLPLGGFGDEAENRKPDEERARRLSPTQPERDAKRIALRARKAFDELEER